MTASTLSNFTKLVLPATLLAGTVFSALTVPLAIYGSEQVIVSVNNQRLFDDRLKDVALPYLGFATLASVGMGVACVSLVGWQQANRRAQALETQSHALQQQLANKEAQVQELMLSDGRLMGSGLSFFLDSEPSLQPGPASVMAANAPLQPAPVPAVSVQAAPVSAAPVHAVVKTASPLPKAQPAVKRPPAVVVQTEAPVIDSLVFGTDLSNASTAGQGAVQSVVSPLAAAQVFIGLTRANQPVAQSSIAHSSATPTLKALATSSNVNSAAYSA
jgi:hypothetical protein